MYSVSNLKLIKAATHPNSNYTFVEDNILLKYLTLFGSYYCFLKLSPRYIQILNYRLRLNEDREEEIVISNL